MGRGSRGGGGHSSGGSHFHSRGSHGSSHSHRSSGRGSRRSSPSFGGGFYSGGGYRRSYRRPYYGGMGYGYRSGSTGLWSTLLIIVLLLVIMAGFRSCSSAGQITASTIERTKVDSGNAYISDCITDELGWIGSPGRLSGELKEFYEETGCQPILILKQYDSSLTTADACEAWSKEYYDTHFAENQNVVLYTYFDDQYGTGIDTLFVGTQSGMVFDEEARQIFWDTLDYYWEDSDLSEQDMFAKTFTDTADRIMTVTTTVNDIVKTALIVVGIVVAGGVVIVLVTKKHKREKEKAQETIDILNADLDDTVDDLAEKYTGKDV